MQKNVLITGASSGFGRLAALAFARAGWQVIATMRSPERGQSLLHEFAGEKSMLQLAQLDVTVEADIEAVARLVTERWGKLDVLINNAGYAVMGAIEDIPMSEWQTQLQTNFLGAVAVTRAMLPLLRAAGRGSRIINISSGAGLLGPPMTGAYAASKFALEGFSESLRFELHPHGIAVILIEPGTYETGISRNHVYFMPDNSPYAAQARKFMALNARSEAKGNDPARVVELLQRVAVMKRPALRYVSGADAAALRFMKRWLPWSWTEWLVRRFLG